MNLKPVASSLCKIVLSLLLVTAAIGQTVQQQIDAIFDVLPGSHTLSGLVETEDGAKIYYSQNADVGKKPASVTKTFTVGAALSLLGQDHQFVTRVYRTGEIDTNGILSGDLILLGNHDFTWAEDYYPGDARYALDRLAERLYDQGLREVTGTVWGYGYLMYAELPSNSSAAAAFRDALNDAGILASATASSSSFYAPGTAFAEWRSMPLSQACRDLLKVSDNDDAQALLRHLAYELKGASSDSVGEELIQDWLESQGVDMSGSVILEGAGLSHSNRVSARQALGLTRTMLNLPEGWAYRSMLPIGGVDGTLGGRFPSAPSFGHVHAKTGTLTGVICLSGYVQNPIDQRRILFAFLMNDISGFDNTTARAAIDDAVTVLAGNIDGLRGAVANAPVLLSVVGDPILGEAQLIWTTVSGALSYNLYSSPDGSVWTFEHTTSATSTSVGGLVNGDALSFCVRAVNGNGESKPSDAYSVRITNTPHRALVVDGNDRWGEGVSENWEAANHAFAVRLSEAVSPAVAVDACANEAITLGLVELNGYDAVLWLTGEESTEHESFAVSEQTLVQAYLNAGGNLFVSGAEIGWDLDHLGGSADRSFYNNVLKANYVADDAGTEQFISLGGIFATLPELLGDFHRMWMIVSYPDVIAPLGGAISNLWYIADDGLLEGAAGIEYDGAHRLVHLGFPFETIGHLAMRRWMMNRILGFFLDAEFPDDILIEARDLSGTVLGMPTVEEHGDWQSSSAKSQVPELGGTGSRYIDYELPNSGTDSLLVTPDIPVAGRYEVYVTWGLGANCYDAQYTIRHVDGTTVLLVDQIPLDVAGANAHQWVSLGEYGFAAGQDVLAGSIELSEVAVSGRPSAGWNQRVYFDGFKLVLRERDGLGFGDYDRDGDTDSGDWLSFADCMAGPGLDPSPPVPESPEACHLAFDAESDHDVDADDFSSFQVAYTDLLQ